MMMIIIITSVTKNGDLVVAHQFFFYLSWLNQNIKNFGFCGKEKQEYNFFSKSKNNQQTEPTYSVYVVTSEFKAQPTMVG